MSRMSVFSEPGAKNFLKKELEPIMTQEQKDKLHKNRTSWFTDVDRSDKSDRSKVSNKLIQPFYDLNPERNVFDKERVYFKNEKIEVAPTSNAHLTCF